MLVWIQVPPYRASRGSFDRFTRKCYDILNYYDSLESSRLLSSSEFRFPPPPPLSREARKLLPFIKSLEKEQDSLYRSRLLIPRLNSVPPHPPPFPREARKLLRFIKSFERRRFVVQFSTLNPRPNSGPPPLSREARKLLPFIKSLEKEHDSLYRSRLLILVRIQLPPPLPARSAEAFKFH